MEINTLSDAITEAVKQTGGTKFYGALLWPEKPLEEARRLLLNCLNDDRAEKLSSEQEMLIMREARKQGNHIIMNYLAQELGYATPAPIQKEDKKEQLMREFILAQQSLSKLAEMINLQG
jgi:hypothetical protein